MAIWFLCLFALLVSQSSAQGPLSAMERYLYAQLEDALINDAATLEQLREVFFQERPNEIPFHVNIRVDSISASKCSGSWMQLPAFCLVEQTTSNGSTSVAQWELCSNTINITWRVSVDVDAVDLIQVLSTIVVPWCGHGPSIITVLFPTSYYDPEESPFVSHGLGDQLIALSVKKLDCQPSLYQLINAIGVLFTWIEVYTEAGGKPQTWDPQQQAHVQKGLKNWGAYWLDDYNWSNTLNPLKTFGVVGCFLLTLLLLLLIPRLFMGYSNKLVIKDTSPGTRSLYWGTAVVCLFLAFIILLGKLCYQFLFNTFYCTDFLDDYSPDPLKCSMFIANVAGEVLISIYFLVISLIASRSSRGVRILATKPVCCCYFSCCPPQRNSTAVHVLTSWAFMTFMYYTITETIALVFTLFISILLTISYMLLYVSVVFFAVMLVSIILYSCQTTGRCQSRQAKCVSVVDVCAILLGFSFIIFVFVAIVAMFSVFGNLQVEGFEAVSLKFSLLPSLALSVAGWLIRKKLLKEDNQTVQPAHPTDHGATGHSLNDGVREDEEEESPDERQHLLA